VISGARKARPSWLRGLVSRAASRELSAFVVPGTEVARACGLDVEAAGIRVVASPRHANVLLVVGELPRGLKEAAAVAYSQMSRFRHSSRSVSASTLASIPRSIPRISETGIMGTSSIRPW
jgi:hypothetical protein